MMLTFRNSGTEPPAMCNHYKNDIRKSVGSTKYYGYEEFSQIKIRFDNAPIDVYPDGKGVVGRLVDGSLQFEQMRWGFPPPPKLRNRPVTNVRNLKSPYWRGWLKPEWRCLVPFTSFAEWTEDKPKREVWFTMSNDAPAYFAGIWRPWTGTRGTKAAPETGEHLLYSFLTCEPNAVVAPIHPKAMPVILGNGAAEAWLTAPTNEAVALAEPLDNSLLRIVN